MKDLFSRPVEKDNGIERPWIVCFKQCYADRHVQSGSEIPELVNEITVFADGEMLYMFFILREIISVAPHLRKECDVSTFCFSFFACFDSGRKIVFKSLSREKLKQCDP